MNILITGVSRGIGYELAKKFADRGLTVYGISRNAEKLKELEKYSEKIKTLEADLTTSSGVAAVGNWIKRKETELNFLINNAGAIVNKPFNEISQEEMLRVYNVNVMAPAILLQQILPLLKAASQNHVVNISSMGGVQGSVKFPGLSMYSSSKGALNTLTECLSVEFEDVNFNALALGAAQTEMLNEAFPGYKAPLNAEEMADFIVLFTLNAHQYLKGKIIPVSLTTP